MTGPIMNPSLPYVGSISGGLGPGRMIRIQGSVNSNAQRFAINLQYGSGMGFDDIALHLNPRFDQECVVRNSLSGSAWGMEERHGGFPFARGQQFNIIILCEQSEFKIAINGRHFAEFTHRLPYQRVSHIYIEGDIYISMITFEGGNLSTGFVSPHAPLMAGGLAPPPNQSLYPSVPHGMPPLPPQTIPSLPDRNPSPLPPGYNVPQYPSQPGRCPSPYPPGYAPPDPYAYPQAPYNQHAGGSYPPPPPGYQQYPGQGYPQGMHRSTSESGLGGILNKAGAAVAGALGTAGVMGALGAKHHGHGHGHGKGYLGPALGAGLAGAALTGHLSPKKMLKAQKKSHKKALKYGLPIVGAGVGAYALKKTLHHGFHRGSSSSSSSSEEE